jgi:hypothetical protein
MSTQTIDRTAGERMQAIITTAVDGALDPSVPAAEVGRMLAEACGDLLPGVRHVHTRTLDGFHPRTYHELWDSDDNRFVFCLNRQSARLTIDFSMMYSTFQDSSSGRSIDVRLNRERLTDRFALLLDEITEWFPLPGDGED